MPRSLGTSIGLKDKLKPSSCLCNPYYVEVKGASYSVGNEK